MDAKLIDWKAVEGKRVTVYFNLQPGQTEPDRLTGKISRDDSMRTMIVLDSEWVGTVYSIIADIDIIVPVEVAGEKGEAGCTR
jgi:hypothetical protein